MTIKEGATKQIVESIIRILEADCMWMEQGANEAFRKTYTLTEKKDILYYDGIALTYDRAKKQVQRSIDAIKKEYGI